MIVGGVGSGKSSMLNALIGHITRKGGEVEVGGRIAYVAQSAWIMNDTLQVGNMDRSLRCCCWTVCAWLCISRKATCLVVTMALRGTREARGNCVKCQGVTERLVPERERGLAGGGAGRYGRAVPRFMEPMAPYRLEAPWHVGLHT